MERIVPKDPDGHIEEAVIEILTLPRNFEQADAFAVITGQLEVGRFAPIDPWNRNATTARYLLVSGQNEKECEREWIDLPRLQTAPYNLRRLENVIVESCALHTRDQTDWLARQVTIRGITSVAAYAAAYHLPRVVMAIIRSFVMVGLRIPIMPIPAPDDLNTISPFEGCPMRDLMAGERDRRKKYVLNGQIATPAEVSYYIRETRPLYPSHVASCHAITSLLARE